MVPHQHIAPPWLRKLAKQAIASVEVLPRAEVNSILDKLDALDRRYVDPALSHRRIVAVEKLMGAYLSRLGLGPLNPIYHSYDEAPGNPLSRAIADAQKALGFRRVDKFLENDASDPFRPSEKEKRLRLRSMIRRADAEAFQDLRALRASLAGDPRYMVERVEYARETASARNESEELNFLLTEYDRLYGSAACSCAE